MEQVGRAPVDEAGFQIMKTVADQFAETLAAAGVKRIYGIVGDSLNGLTDAEDGDESPKAHIPAEGRNGSHP